MARLANQMKQLYAMCATALVMGRADLDGADDVGFDIELPIFTVGQTAELANIHPQTLRQYDRLGLVRPQRTDGGARRYCLRDIARLTRAQRLSQDEGINLSGIARILVLEEENRQLRREVKRMQTGDQESVFAAGRDGNIVEVQRSNRARLWRNAIRRETRELPGRDTAADTGVAVSTAFRWRHRFLTAVVPQQPKALEGLLEVDETYFLHSRKGERNLPREARKRGGKASKRGLSKEQVPVLIARARGQQHTADRVMPAMNGKELVATLRPLVRPDTVVCSDGNSAYYALPRELGVTLKMFSASKHGSPQNPSFHVQTVNGYHSRLKGWLNCELRGVATKYLPNYLAWQRLLTWFKDGISPAQFIASALGRQLINT